MIFYDLEKFLFHKIQDIILMKELEIIVISLAEKLSSSPERSYIVC